MFHCKALLFCPMVEPKLINFSNSHRAVHFCLLESSPPATQHFGNTVIRLHSIHLLPAHA